MIKTLTNLSLLIAGQKIRYILLLFFFFCTTYIHKVNQKSYPLIHLSFDVLTPEQIKRRSDQ